MSVSATFTIEMSRNAINPAIIAAAVISGLLPRRTVSSSVMSRPRVDGDLGAHARAQRDVVPAVEPDEDGDALHHFVEVPGGVVGRQQREARAGRAGDALDVTSE